MDAALRRTLCDGAQFGRKTAVRGRGGIVVTSHPVATRLAVEVLRAGGNACDAALTAAVVQTVVEPHMTTITGMLSMLHRDAAGATTYLNGSVNAPLEPLPGFGLADCATGRGVAVPGFWAALEAALERHGTLSRAQLLAPAIELARNGFEIHPFLFGDMYSSLDRLGRSEEGREMYMPQRSLLRPGDLLRQERAAQTLERLAAEGSDHFYRGAFAEHLCEVVRGAGGVLTRHDLERYEVRWQEPLRGTYRDHEIVTAPPPDSGGAHIIEALNMIELLDLRALGHPTESPQTLFTMMRATHSVQAEGARFGDPRTHHIPLDVLLSKEYAAMRLALLRTGATRPPPSPPRPGSNHVTVVDGEGAIATLLHSCLCDFCDNGLFVDGIGVCAAGGHFLRTMPRPGERASIFVAPNIVLRQGRPVLASGSPSLSLIPAIVQNTVNLLDFGLGIEESVHLPRFGAAYHHGQLIEADLAPGVREEVATLGIPLEVVSPWHYIMGSFEGVVMDQDGGLEACADPRRTGAAEVVTPADGCRSAGDLATTDVC